MNPWEELKKYVAASDKDDLFVEACWEEAVELVSAFVGTATVPSYTYTRAVKETGAALFHRRNSQNGIAGFNAQSVPVFTAKDPMNAVYPMLRPFVGWF